MFNAYQQTQSPRGVKLEREPFIAHLAALVGETARHVAPQHATTARPASPPSDLAARLWRAAAAPDGTPGARYLVERRQAWPAGERFPASVRWLPAESARRVVRPRVPDGAAGCVVYRFGSPGEADTNAAQLEAVDTDGVRVKFYPWRPEKDRAKRPSVSGCTFDGGRRVFRARGDPDLAIHVCEGPLDALALVHLERLDLVALQGGAVHGTSGAALFRPAACPVRWLPAESGGAWSGHGCRTARPVVYRFGSPGEADTNAVQLEAATQTACG